MFIIPRIFGIVLAGEGWGTLEQQCGLETTWKTETRNAFPPVLASLGWLGLGLSYYASFSISLGQNGTERRVKEIIRSQY